MSSTRTRWGRTRTGGSVWPPALAVGLVVTAAMAGLARLGATPGHPWELPLIVAAGALPVGVMLGWALVVDRRTVAGAVDRPEESAEGRWLDRAHEGAFRDVLVVAGLALPVLLWVPALRDVRGTTVLTVLLVGSMLDTLVRYQVIARREG